MENEKVQKIQIATNATIKEMMSHQNNQMKMFKKIMMITIIGFVATTCITIGGVLYALNSYALEETETTITVEGETASYIEGDNNSVSVGDK